MVQAGSERPQIRKLSIIILQSYDGFEEDWYSYRGEIKHHPQYHQKRIKTSGSRSSDVQLPSPGSEKELESIDVGDGPGLRQARKDGLP